MMERRPRPDWIDEGLWVRLAGVDARCFIRGNAHTHPGRFGVWSDSLDRGLAASKDEIVECSDASRWWVEGFLSGNEPSFGDYYGYQADDRDVHADDLRWDRLRSPTARFRDTGSHGQIAREPPITIPAAVIDGFPRVWHGGEETTWLRDRMADGCSQARISTRSR